MEKGTNFLYSVKYQQNTQKRGSHMSNLNTELMTALLKNESIDEVFRSHREAAMNDLLKIELETTIITLYKKGITTREISDLIERSNKGLKHKSKSKEQFPNEDALDRFVCCYYSDLNRSYSERMQRGFCQASAEILQLFEGKL